MILKRFINWIKKFFPKRIIKYQTSTEGKYLILYIIDKYLNETRPDDHIDKYESVIDQHLIFLENKNFYFNLANLTHYTEEIDQDTKRIFAAIYVLIYLIIFMNEEEREFYLNSIKLSLYKNFIEGFLEFSGDELKNELQKNANLPFS